MLCSRTTNGAICITDGYNPPHMRLPPSHDVCLLAFSKCEAAHGESHIRTSDAVAAARMQNITTIVLYRERSPRAPPNNQTWAAGTWPLTQHYSDKSRRDLSENATGNSHNTCRSRVIFHIHTLRSHGMTINPHTCRVAEYVSLCWLNLVHVEVGKK